MVTCIMDTLIYASWKHASGIYTSWKRILDTSIMDTCIMDTCIMVTRTKSRGSKGLQLEVGAWRAPRLLVFYDWMDIDTCG